MFTMALEDDVKEIVRRKKGIIVIVDDACWAQSKLFSEHSNTELDCLHIAEKMGIDLLLPESSYSKYTTPEDAYSLEGHIERSRPNLLLVRPKMLGDAPDLLTTFNKIAKFRKTHPNTKTYLYMPQTNRAALDKVLPIFKDQGMFDETIKINFDLYPTTWHHLRALLTGKPPISEQERHRYKNDMWRKNYLPFIDKSLRAGNSQTNNNYQFIILSNREIMLLGSNEVNAKEKVMLKPLMSDLTDEELQNCAAIFIDNDWNKTIKGHLGKGINALKKVRAQLDQKGINPSIVYQSGHNLEEFSQTEIQEVENLGAVLATKDIFPTVTTKAKAEKEEEMCRVLQAHPVLGKYTVKIYKILGNEPTCVVCTKIVEDTPIDEEALKKLGIESSPMSHRMYVLAHLHSYLKDQINNEKINKTEVPQFRDFNYILKGSWSEEQEKFMKEPKTRKLYEKIIQEHAKDKPRTIIHNDAKWDNWFGNVLGDFADACAGTEYKDIANALLLRNENNRIMPFALIKKDVNDQINNYITVRKSIEPKFKPGRNFARKVKEMIYVQSIRLARNKLQFNDNGIVDNLILDIAKNYEKFMLQAP